MYNQIFSRLQTYGAAKSMVYLLSKRALLHKIEIENRIFGVKLRGE